MKPEIENSFPAFFSTRGFLAFESVFFLALFGAFAWALAATVGSGSPLSAPPWIAAFLLGLHGMFCMSLLADPGSAPRRGLGASSVWAAGWPRAAKAGARLSALHFVSANAIVGFSLATAIWPDHSMASLARDLDWASAAWASLMAAHIGARARSGAARKKIGEIEAQEFELA
jgi:hypothetical protein